MLESFISTQKLSVQKALAKKFRRFMTAKADFNQLALYKLQASCTFGGAVQPWDCRRSWTVGC